MSVLPSGDQWTIEAGGYAGTVVSVGGGLRGLTFEGREVLLGYGESEPPHAGIGQHLFPWPNRITDGKYSFNGVDQQLYLTEPPRQERDPRPHPLGELEPPRRRLRPVDRRGRLPPARTARLPAPARPPPALPPRRAADRDRIRHQRRRDRGAVRVWRAPVSERRPADRRVRAGVQRRALAGGLTGQLTPVGLAPVAGSPFDFSTARQLGELDIDNAFTGLDGTWSITLSAPDSGARSTLSGDTPWVQLYTGSAIGRTALAVNR